MLSTRISAVWSLIILSFFSLTSCDDDSNLGLELQPDQLQVSTDFTTLDLVSSTIWFDSVRTFNTTRMLAGRTSSPEFGDTKATSYTEFILPAEDEVDLFLGVTDLATIGRDSIVYDSLTLRYAYDITDGNVDLQNTQKFFLHRLAEGLDTASNETFYTFNSLTKGDLISELDFQPTDSTSFMLFHLDDAIGELLFQTALLGSLTSSEDLQAILKGVAISTDDNGEAIYGLDLTNATSNLSLHYHYYEDGDTIFRTFPMLMGNHFHQIEVDRTGSPLEGLAKNTLLPSSMTNNQSYVQAGTGLCTYIQIPEEIKDFGLDDNIAINRVELIIRPVDGSVTDATTPPIILELLRADEDGRVAFVTGSTLENVVLDDANRRSLGYNPGGEGYFPFIFSRYIEDLANEREENNGFFISPETFTALNNAADNTSTNRLILGDSNYTGTLPLQFRIYYTIFK